MHTYSDRLYAHLSKTSDLNFPPSPNVPLLFESRTSKHHGQSHSITMHVPRPLICECNMYSPPHLFAVAVPRRYYPSTWSFCTAAT